MRKVLLAAVVLFGWTACVPLVQTAQSETATLGRDAGDVVFTAGAREAFDVAVYLRGDITAVEVPAPASCARVGRGWGCSIGDVPGDAQYRIRVTGTPTSGSATFYRGSSLAPRYILLAP